MKNVIFYLLMICFIATGQAQVTQLEEALVRFSPKSVKISSDLDNFEYTVVEKHKNQFTMNPIAFMKENFNIQDYIASSGNLNTDYFDVSFISEKGRLDAVFSKEGELLSTHQVFKDKPLPLDLRRQLVTAHNGWTMRKNKYIASGKSDRIDKEVYKITIANGSKNKSIKLYPNRYGKSNSSVASN